MIMPRITVSPAQPAGYGPDDYYGLSMLATSFGAATAPAAAVPYTPPATSMTSGILLAALGAAVGYGVSRYAGTPPALSIGAGAVLGLVLA